MRVPWIDDAMALVDEPGIDVIVELIGRSDGIAKRLCETALERGVSVVTANKALIAEHGNTLMRLATASGATLAFEAAVAGGIPIIKSIREGLSANAISRVYGILNGTCHYILSGMRETGRGFDRRCDDAPGERGGSDRCAPRDPRARRHRRAAVHDPNGIVLTAARASCARGRVSAIRPGSRGVCRMQSAASRAASRPLSDA
jgi:hypothetical protein